MNATPVHGLGLRVVNVVAELGKIAVFSGQVAMATVRRPLRFRRLVDELYHIGVLSLAIVCVSGWAVGMVLALQGYNTLSTFGAEEALGAVVGLSLIRELGPVLTALLVTGRAGSAIAAEIGSMVASEQIDGLRLMSIDPLDLVIAPKALAMLLTMPLLSALFIAFGLSGGFVVGAYFLGIDPGSYLTGLEGAIEFESDVLGSLIKAVAFGLLVGIVATYRGFMAEPTSAGVSAATTSTVVVGSVATLIIDYFITALWGV